jgi:hypothetical protein
MHTFCKTNEQNNLKCISKCPTKGGELFNSLGLANIILAYKETLPLKGARVLSEITRYHPF